MKLKPNFSDDQVLAYIEDKIKYNEASDREIKFYNTCYAADRLINNKFSRSIKEEMLNEGGY